MHGVKRLFAWMIPRFDKTRFNVSLISLRKKDLSADTLEEFGIDVTYMARHKFDPATFPALLKVLREKRADIVHLHGYGATTFGRLCAWRMGIPAILHEHANHGDTPWFQKVADRLLAPHTDLAIAVSESTGEFTTRARLMPAERTKVVYLGAPLDEFARPRSAEEIAAARQAIGIAPGTIAIGTITRLMPSKGNQYLIEAAPQIVEKHPTARVFIVGEGELQARARGAGARLATRRQARLQRFHARCGRGPLGVRHRRLSVAVGRHAADRVRSAGDGEADRRDRCRRPARRAHRSQGRADRAEGRRRRAGARGVASCVDNPPLAAGLVAEARKTGQRYDIAAFVRKMERLYELLHETSRAPGRAGILKADLSFLTTQRR